MEVLRGPPRARWIQSTYPIHIFATFPDRLLDFINLIMFYESISYKVPRFRRPFTSFLSAPNFFLSTMFSDTLHLLPPFGLETKFHTHT
jgi:hypothetical protein